MITHQWKTRNKCGQPGGKCHAHQTYGSSCAVTMQMASQHKPNVWKGNCTLGTLVVSCSARLFILQSTTTPWKHVCPWLGWWTPGQPASLKAVTPTRQGICCTCGLKGQITMNIWSWMGYREPVNYSHLHCELPKVCCWQENRSKPQTLGALIHACGN